MYDLNEYQVTRNGRKETLAARTDAQARIAQDLWQRERRQARRAKGAARRALSERATVGGKRP